MKGNVLGGEAPKAALHSDHRRHPGFAMTTTDEEDRREYYRIEDHVALQISPLSASQADPATVLRDASPLFNLLGELHVAEFESQHLLRQLSDKDRTLAAFLRAQNKRIDLLGAVLAQTLLGELGEPRRVILSEGGIEFTQAEPLQAQARVAVRMLLMPQGLGLLLRGRVVHCQGNAQGGHDAAVEFVDLSDAQRQLLARHVLQRQQQQRRDALDHPAATAD